MQLKGRTNISAALVECANSYVQYSELLRIMIHYFGLEEPYH